MIQYKDHVEWGVFELTGDLSESLALTNQCERSMSDSGVHKRRRECAMLLNNLFNDNLSIYSS